MPVPEADPHQAREVFLTGTASELVPAREIDGHRFEPCGPVFGRLARAFHDTVRGRAFGDLGWSTGVSEQ
ncbi:hypothetical protein AQJ43_29005 [Streptomyces avermitilis]|nr:hypothetical protein [Streptomyces avermitilis]KUN51277.1 hypothetical protein AQJ43_29005 [Streptomyces avermitilis]OOV20940.1 hypothetical protein SM007_35685 [Streptomyces avermitilis]